MQQPSPFLTGLEKREGEGIGAASLCSLPRKGLPLLRNAFVTVKPCSVEEFR